jgi:hypothetical protein
MTETLTQPPKTRPLLLSLLTLLSGIVIGVGATLIVVGPDEPVARPPVNKRMLDHLMRELELTEAQRQVIEPIITEHLAELDALRRQAQPKISAVIDNMYAEIARTLDDRQKKVLTVKMQRMQEFFDRMRSRGGRGGPGDGPRRGNDDRRDRPRRGDDHDADDDPNAPRPFRTRPPGAMPPLPPAGF